MKQNDCKRQHYIPQFLQKGFTTDDKENQTNVVTKDKIYKSNIKDVYVENLFFSELPDKESNIVTLDQKITYKEHEILRTLNLLKSLPYDTEINMTLDYSNFIFHFFLRNKQFSKTFTNSIISAILKRISHELCDNACEIFSNEHGHEIFEHIKIIENIQLNRKTTRDLKKHPEKIKKAVYDFIQPEFHNIIEENLKNIIESNTLFRRIINSFSVEKSDNNFLNNWKFKIIKGHFVLPDTIFTSYSNEWDYDFAPIIGKEFSYTLFPIQKDKIIILYPDKFPDSNTFDETQINRYLTSNSDLFITNDIKIDNFEKLKNNLGKNFLEKSLNQLFEINSKKEQINKISQNLKEEIIPMLRTKTGYKP